MGRMLQQVTFALAALAALMSCVPGAAPALAQVPALDLDIVERPAARETSIAVGLGVAATPEYQGSADYRVAPVPYFKIASHWPGGQYVQLVGPTLMANVLPGAVWQAGPLLRYRGKRDDVTNEQVDAMKPVDGALEAGGFAGLQQNRWFARVEASADVSGSYDGFLLSVKGGHEIPLTPAVSVTLSLSTTYADANFMQTYFGVDAEDAGLSGLRRYDAGAGLKDVTGAVLAKYRVNGRWGLTASVGLTRLLGDAADSPLVEDVGNATQPFGGAAVTYTF